MSVAPIRIAIDPTNPGQFFACCGLLELADRLWAGAEGWFEPDAGCFCLRALGVAPTDAPVDPATLLATLIGCRLANTMTEAQVGRRRTLAALPQQAKKEDGALEQEKKELDKLWRESPVLLGAPFELRLDWFLDERSGGSDFKTWAGQQSVIDIAEAMRAAVAAVRWPELPCRGWFSCSSAGTGLPFNFDSDLGETGSPIDVGFSFDPLHIGTRTRPLIELGAFIGLQRFRPARPGKENLFRYWQWFVPLAPVAAAAACCGALTLTERSAHEFRLLFRSKYLKSFLSSIPRGGV